MAASGVARLIKLKNSKGSYAPVNLGKPYGHEEFHDLKPDRGTEKRPPGDRRTVGDPMSDITSRSRHTATTARTDGSEPSKQSSQTLYYPESSSNEAGGWDIFRLLPPKPDNFGRGYWYDVSLQVLKISCFFILFILTLASATVAKSAFLLMTSAIGFGGYNMTICTDKIPEGTVNTVRIRQRHVVKWVWAVYMSLCAPEVICFLRSLHRTLCRNVKRPTVLQFIVVFVVESLHAVGVGILVFRIFPNLDAITAAMLTNALCFTLCILSLVSRKPSKIAMLLIVFDIACIAAQSTGFWAWPAMTRSLHNHAWALPISLSLISVAWWTNFVHPQSMFPPVRAMANFASALNERRSKTYVIVSVWKCLIYMLSIFLFISNRMPLEQLLQGDPFGEKLITITARNLNQSQINKFYARMREIETSDFYDDPLDNGEVPSADGHEEPPQWMPRSEIVNPNEIADGNHIVNRVKRLVIDPMDSISAYNIFDDYVELNQFTSPYDALWVVLVQVCAVVLCYHSSKFACKVMMQRMGFALPMLLSVPTTVLVLSSLCVQRQSDSCHMTSILSKELFWNCSGRDFTFYAFASSPTTWIWLCWLVSQFWVTIHVWMPQHERLAKTEKLFMLSSYNGAFVDQALAFSRRRDDKVRILAEDLEPEAEDISTYGTLSGISQGTSQGKTPPSECSASSSKVENGLIREAPSSADAITKIYACATMWHESSVEMTCMLKSIFRMDEDQCARRNAQKYLKVIDPDYYEFEAHIFFDDAFELNDYGEPIANKFVVQFIEKVDEAASAVHQTQMRLKMPKKSTTPYGGRISYVLPGRNRMTVHLKDKLKIRHRKRWSQVMYLYYLLGYRLMMKVDDENRKEVISENTFILTLDGDVDFTPQCVNLLVDLMKKNRRLGAACGRIHPRGSGLMVWYQKFEYAVGHWLQKATEHMIGCVLCSPGCFSLFRSYALMDDNVTRRYATKSENPVDYIQYDQGEDRWLCTLLLQRGYRVEYCAASDALTFAPESFNEFFNQRRRWIPSTIANIIDLLKDYKNVVHVNDSISIWYIIYQIVMLISSILGPGTIFLMVVGAISISFNIDTIAALIVVTLPVAFFCVTCLVGKPQKQLLVAQIIGALFAMLMTAVIVGTSLQIQKDGILSPHSIFLFAVIASFFTAALLHPLEFTCIIPGILYFLAIPCMYMLLPIYSVCNLNTVSWGTREEPKLDEKAKANRNGTRIDLVGNSMGNDVDGEISVGCGSACRVLCCLKPDKMESSPQMWRLNEKLEEINRKLDKYDRRSGALRRHSSVLRDNTGKNVEKWDEMEEDEQAELDDNRDMSNQSAAAMRNRKWKPAEAWLNERSLKRAERDYMEHEEESFWKDAIEKYLSPIAVDSKDQDRVQLGLNDLRNKVCSAFFMINVVFIIIVLVLQLQKDCLHIEWPLGPKFNHTVIPCHGDSKEEVWVLTRLQLEPIGLVFLVFFMSILVIQFFAMLLHRFGTLEHIIASTELFFQRKPIDRLSEDELVVQNAVEIARELQAIRGVDETDQETLPEERPISRRRVVQNLESSRRSMMKHRTETLDAAFKKRFFALSSEKVDETGGGSFGSRERRLTLRKSTIRAIQQRRDSVFGTLDKRKSAPCLDGNETTSRGRAPAQRRLERIFNRDLSPQETVVDMSTASPVSPPTPSPELNQADSSHQPDSKVRF